MKFEEFMLIAGDIDYRGDCPQELAEQVQLFAWLRSQPELAKRALHPRNEGRRTKLQAFRERSEGMLTGAPDVVIVGSPCVVIELKRRDHTKSTWQPRQVEVLRAMHAAGAIVVIALGAAAAAQWLLDNPELWKPS